MTDLVEKAKRLGLHDSNLQQIFDRVEELQTKLEESQERDKEVKEALKLIALRPWHSQVRAIAERAINLLDGK